MRTRKIIIVVVLLVLLLGGAGAIFLSRDSGPPVLVVGNLSAKDVAQIKKAVRWHLWHEAFPNFSMQTLKALPGAVKLARTTRVTSIGGNQHEATAWLSDGYLFTNGPAGWAWHGTTCSFGRWD